MRARVEQETPDRAFLTALDRATKFESCPCFFVAVLKSFREVSSNMTHASIFQISSWKWKRFSFCVTKFLLSKAILLNFLSTFWPCCKNSVDTVSGYPELLLSFEQLWAVFVWNPMWCIFYQSGSENFKRWWSAKNVFLQEDHKRQTTNQIE